jgi:hypothetical protein
MIMTENRSMTPAANRWLAEVYKIMKGEYFLDSEGAGWDQEQIERYFVFGDTPAEFIAWYAEKYDLYEFRGYR